MFTSLCPQDYLQDSAAREEHTVSSGHSWLQLLKGSKVQLQVEGVRSPVVQQSSRWQLGTHTKCSSTPTTNLVGFCLRRVVKGLTKLNRKLGPQAAGPSSPRRLFGWWYYSSSVIYVPMNEMGNLKLPSQKRDLQKKITTQQSAAQQVLTSGGLSYGKRGLSVHLCILGEMLN